jgi:hypothetical protein
MKKQSQTYESSSVGSADWWARAGLLIPTALAIIALTGINIPCQRHFSKPTAPGVIIESISETTLINSFKNILRYAVPNIFYKDEVHIQSYSIFPIWLEINCTKLITDNEIRSPKKGDIELVVLWDVPSKLGLGGQIESKYIINGPVEYFRFDPPFPSVNEVYTRAIIRCPISVLEDIRRIDEKLKDLKPVIVDDIKTFAVNATLLEVYSPEQAWIMAQNWYLGDTELREAQNCEPVGKCLIGIRCHFINTDGRHIYTTGKLGKPYYYTLFHVFVDFAEDEQ